MSDDWPPVLERGVAGLAHVGEGRSGDVAVFAPCARGGLLAVIDGLGHGDHAADAADQAAAVVRERAEEAPAVLLEACHRALRATRGAVMTLAWFDVERGTMDWTGVGNVEARLMRAGARPNSPVVLAGVVGFNLPKARVSTVALEPGDTVVLATDGVGADFSEGVDPAVGAQRLADLVLQRYGKGTDDAIVAVVRYVPS